MKEFDNLKAYLPSVVVKKIVEDANASENGKTTVVRIPFSQDFKTISLFADVSGFTPLSEGLCQFGGEGIEELASQLNKYVGQLVKLTSRAGGDVLKFAGDAMLALWPPSEDADLATNAQRAIQCALDMQLRLKQYYFKYHERDEEGRDIEDKIRFEGVLNVKIGIGVGDVSILHIGGNSDNIMNERYEYVATGEALEEAFEAEGFAKPGNVIVSKGVYALVKNMFEGHLVKESKSAKCMLIQDWKTEIRWRKFPEEASSTASDAGEKRLWKYVPAAVMPYLNESNEFWAPELRRVTTLFCSLGMKPEDYKSAAVMQDVFSRMQESVFQYEGTINKFLVDDKGSTLIAVFGLPPFAHENDATRGVLSAMSVMSHLHDLGRVGSVGLTTGVAFCGVVGTRGNRREYSVIGDAVNLAARLMVAAKVNKYDHLMDTETSRAIREDLVTRDMGTVEVKGKKVPIQVYRIANDLHHVGSQTNMDTIPKVDHKKKKSTMLGSPTKAKGLSLNEVSKRKTNVMAKVQREQVAAITSAPKLRQQVNNSKKSSAITATSPANLHEKMQLAQLAGAVESFAASTSDQTEVPVLKIDTSRSVRAAKIRFDPRDDQASTTSTATTTSAVSTNGKKPVSSDASQDDSMIANITIAITEDMKTIADLKVHAMQKLQNRQLIRTGADPKGYVFVAPNDSHEMAETAKLDDFEEILKLVLVPSKHRSNGGGFPTNRPGSNTIIDDDGEPVIGQHRDAGMDIETVDNVAEVLEAARKKLLYNNLGSTVLVDGEQGVGKTRVAREVLIESMSRTRVRTAVAMGNPYETAALSRPFSVWGVLLLQFIDDVIEATGQLIDNADEFQICQARMTVVKEACLRMDANFKLARLQKLDDILDTTFGFVAPPSSPSAVNIKAEQAAKIIRANDVDLEVVDVLKTLVCGLAKDTPLCAVIDDSHYMDIGSWRLSLELAKNPRPRVLTVLLHRALVLPEMFVPTKTGGAAAQVDVFEGVDKHNMRAIENDNGRRLNAISEMSNAICKLEGSIRCEKKPNPAKTREIIMDALKVDNIPDSLVDFLKFKSAGNALYIRDAVEIYLAEDLIQVKNKKCIISTKFEKLRKYQDLPVPNVVGGICSTLLDSMSTTQQIALKVAAMIGESFSFYMVESIFPISALKENLVAEWSALVRMKIIEQVGIENMNMNMQDNRSKKENFRFVNGWMLETLKSRMLFKQRRKLNEIYKLLLRKDEETSRAKFMETTINKLVVKNEGWLYVRKDHARNHLKPWKKRWCVLEGDELIQYYEKGNPKRLEVINLRGPGTKVMNKPFYNGDQQYPYCFAIFSTKWTKKGVEIRDAREFLMAPDTQDEQQNWVFKVGFQIDFYNIQASSGISGRQDFDVYQNPSSSNDFLENIDGHVSSIAGVRKGRSENPQAKATRLTAKSPPPRQSMSFLSRVVDAISDTRRTSSTVSSNAVKTARPPGAPSSGNSSPKRGTQENNGRDSVAELGGEYENPGARVDFMTASDFKAISQDEALATFWASDETTVDDVLVLRQAHHVSWFFEFGDMGLVSRNGAGQIDGYLLGFVSSRQRTHGVVHTIAVLPSVRKHGVGRKLYHRFGQLCEERGCTLMRALVPKDSANTIAFHRALGFEEFIEASDRLTDLGGEHLVFAKSFNQSGTTVVRRSMNPEGGV